MKTSCIRAPENNRYIQVNEWQIRFCQGNHCAALLLSFFSHWHNWKLENDQFYFKVNNITEVHGDGRPYIQNAYLFFTSEELIEGTLNFYGRNAINDALQLLVELQVLSIHKNPNPKYHFDKTKYFKFYPAICNEWIADTYPICNIKSKKQPQTIDTTDLPKKEDASSKNKLTSTDFKQPSEKKGRAITNTTNHTTNNNHSFIDEPDFDSSFLDEATVQPSADVQEIIHALVDKGMPEERFQYDDVVPIIEDLMGQGATVTHFVKAYDLSTNMTKQGSFGIRYLQKVVEHLLKQAKKEPVVYRSPSCPQGQDSHDLKNGLHWLGDLANDDKKGEK